MKQDPPESVGSGRILQLSVSPGGVPKHAVPIARVTIQGLDGDAHRNMEHHGGPERAVCLFSMEQIQALRAEGHAISPGALGENVTVEGIEWDAFVPGARIHLGDEVVLEITRYTTPCINVSLAFRHGNFLRVSQKIHPGWSRVYARVLSPGVVRAGDPVRLLSDADASATPRATT